MYIYIPIRTKINRFLMNVLNCSSESALLDAPTEPDTKN